MGDWGSAHAAGAGDGRQRTGGQSVLTPPAGVPVVPDLGVTIPAQRQHTPPAPVSPPAPPAQQAVVNPCTCGHGMAAHEHYRPGTDCGACGRARCGAYQPASGRVRRLLRRLGLAR
jgi:hypothetical protein